MDRLRTDPKSHAALNVTLNSTNGKNREIYSIRTSYILIKVKYMCTDRLRGGGDIENAETNRYIPEDGAWQFIFTRFLACAAYL